MLRTIRSVPLLKPIQPKIKMAAARNMSIVFMSDNLSEV
jgi:hypothetical protein